MDIHTYIFENALEFIFLRIMVISQLFHVKNLYRNIKNRHIPSGLMDIFVNIIE